MALHQGETLKRLIDNQSMPNEEVARLAGISLSSLYNYYNMEEVPAKKLRMLCAVLKADYIKTFVAPDQFSDNILHDDGDLNSDENIQLKQIINLLKRQTEQQAEIIVRQAEMLALLKKKN